MGIVVVDLDLSESQYVDVSCVCYWCYNCGGRCPAVGAAWLSEVQGSVLQAVMTLCAASSDDTVCCQQRWHSVLPAVMTLCAASSDVCCQEWCVLPAVLTWPQKLHKLWVELIDMSDTAHSTPHTLHTSCTAHSHLIHWTHHELHASCIGHRLNCSVTINEFWRRG